MCNAGPKIAVSMIYGKQLEILDRWRSTRVVERIPHFSEVAPTPDIEGRGNQRILKVV